MPKNAYKTEITDHHINLNTDGSTEMLAFCWIEVNKAIRINGLKIVRLNGLLQVKWALDSTLNGDYRHIVHPIDNGFREKVEETLISDYQRMADNEKIRKLSIDLADLKTQQKKAMEENHESLADAIGKAIESLDGEIQQG